MKAARIPGASSGIGRVMAPMLDALDPVAIAAVLDRIVAGAMAST